MTLSYTVPCHRREADWAIVRPVVQRAAQQAGDVEIVLVDYGNPAPLPDATVRVEASYYHMAHARNVGIRAASGDVVVIGSTDIVLDPALFGIVRASLAFSTSGWVCPATRYLGIIAAPRAYLLDVGGFDERFEFYGPEDKDLAERLERRYGPPGRYPDGYLSVIRTPDTMKTLHYRLPLTKAAMHAQGRAVLDANRAQQTIIANEGRAWGSIQPPS